MAGTASTKASKGGATVQCRGLAVSRVLEFAEAERTAEACAPVFGGDPCGELTDPERLRLRLRVKRRRRH